METAILMASGLGTRMRPITKSIPKPLVYVGEKPLIETVITALQRRGVERIVIVVGYLSEQFNYLLDKYTNVIIVKNNVYKEINNISSIYYAREYLLDGATFICEADLFVEDENLLCRELGNSCYFGKMIVGYSADWVFELDNEKHIRRIGRGGNNCYNMVGVAYLDPNDSKKLKKIIELEYGKPGYEVLFWDDVMNMHIDEFELKIQPVNAEQIIEIDTVEELDAVRKKFVGE